MNVEVYEVTFGPGGYWDVEATDKNGREVTFNASKPLALRLAQRMANGESSIVLDRRDVRYRDEWLYGHRTPSAQR